MLGFLVCLLRSRRGIPHFLQPHAFIPRGRAELRRTLPDDAGATGSPAESSDCGVIYFTRYYRQRSTFDLPDGPWLLGPRGDLGYLGYSTFPGDNRTFAAVIAVPTGVPQWRAFRDAGVFEAAVAKIQALRSWVIQKASTPSPTCCRWQVCGTP